MDMNMLTIFLIAVAVPLTEGVNCYTCTHFVTDSPLDPIDDQACHNSDTSQMESKKCLTGSACFKVTGTFSFQEEGTSFSGEMTNRGCLNKDSPDGDKCEPATALSIGVPGEVSVSGMQCICTTDNCNGQSMTAPEIFTFGFSLVMIIFVSL